MKKLLFLLFVFALLALFGREYFFPEKTATDKQTAEDFNPDDFADMEDISAADETLALRIIAANPPINPIEQSRNATLFIATPWGNIGSGFILNTDCHAVTNKQLFAADASKFIVDQEKLRNSIAAIQEELQALDAEHDYVMDVQGYGDNSRQIDSEMAALARTENKLQQQLDKLSVVTSRTDFTVYFIDGSEYEVKNAKLSDDHDLAFFQLPETHCPQINIGCTHHIDKGQTLMTLGSEGKLDFLVQQGEYLGETELDGEVYLQTTAPIHAGNAGGPLLDKRGDVVGISTRKLLDQEDLGYAIPMHIVIKEFEKYLPQ